MLKRLVLLAFAVFAVVFSRGGVVPNVAIHEVSSGFSSGIDQRRATNIVNGVGLFGDAHTYVPQGAMWLTAPDTAGAVQQAFVVFDLGSVRTINLMKVWNYNEIASGANILTRRGIQTADILIAGEDLNFTVHKAAQTFTRATGTFSNQHDVVDMGGVQARYVRINVLSNFGGDNRVGLSEVQFIDNSLSPFVRRQTRSYSGDRVVVQFSEAMDPTTALDKANYAISPRGGGAAVTITSAEFNNGFKDAVLLRLASPLAEGTGYAISVSGVRDLSNLATMQLDGGLIEPELFVWLKADAGVTAMEGFVSMWADQSFAGNDAAQGDPVSQPTVVESAVNGKPAIHFDGATSLLEIPHPESPLESGIVANRDLTLYLVLSFDQPNGFRYHGPIGINNNNVPASFDLYMDRNDSKIRFLRGNGSGNTAFAGTAALQPDTFYILSVVMRGTNAAMYLNGSFNGSAAIPQGLWTAGNPIRLGLRQDNGTRFAGSIAETMIFRGAVSDAERATIDQYLGTKYGINVIALEITRHPESVTVEAGQSAAFGVAAVAGTPDIRYQWQRNNQNIAGATGPTYRTPALTAADNEATFRVIVSTALGVTQTSQAATVTVTADTSNPTLASAVRTNPETILVTFSEPVDSASALVATNYELNNGAAVQTVSAGGLNQVFLGITGASADGVYRLTVRNVADLASHTIAPSSMMVLPGSLALWVNADTGLSVDGLGYVREWRDLSPNGNHAVQFDTGGRPAPATGAINGHNAVTFDGADDSVEAAHSPSLAIAGDISIFAVVNIANYGNFRGIVSKTAVNQPASFDFYAMNSQTGGQRLYRGNGLGVNGVIGSGANPDAGTPAILTATHQGSAVSYTLNGQPNVGGTLNVATADAGTPLRIGNRNDGATPMAGEIAEVLVFNGAVSDADRRAINTYLGLKYFPFAILQQPQNVTAMQGTTARFFVEAAAGGASFQYQWQRNNENIPGANSFEYITPELAMADHATTYRVIISAPGMEPATSESAQLIVSGDDLPPMVVSIGRRLWEPNVIVVRFDEPIDPASVTTANFTIDNGSITAVAAGSSPSEVLITTSAPADGTVYNITPRGVRDRFGNTMAETAVAVGVYPSALALWLRADRGVTQADNLVSAWADQSGNGNNAIVAAPEFSPTFVADGGNGLPAVNFDGVNHYLYILPSGTLAPLGDMAIFAVTKIPSYPAPTFIGITGKTGGAGRNVPAPYDFYLSPSGVPAFFRGNGTVLGSSAGTAAPSPNETHLISVVMRGPDVSHFIDGEINGTGSINTTIEDAGNEAGVGTRTDLFTKMFGQMQELMIFNGTLSAGDQVAIDTYLMEKYGIGGDEPQPELTVTRNGNEIQISWPAPSTGFVLESTPSLIAPDWREVGNPAVVIGGVQTVHVAIGAGNQFFRLRKP